MAILLLSEIFPPKHGGSGRWFFELYKRLTPGTVAIVTNQNGPGDAEVDAHYPQKLVRLPMASTSWGVLSVTGLRFYLRTLVKIWKHKPNNLSQIHCGRSLPEGLLGLVLAKLWRKPLVCYVHGEDIEVARTSRELAVIVKAVLKGANTLICNSRNTQRLLTEHWQIPEHKIAIIHPGVDAERFTPAKPDPAFRERLGWSNRYVCLTVGRLQRRKGHDRMIEALPALLKVEPDLHYAIIGQGDQYPALQQRVANLGLMNRVQFLDELPDEDLVGCYQQCNLFILPNRADGNDIEGFGMVLVEAQATGKPVIAGDSGGTAETMRPGETGLIADCTKPACIGEAIRQLRQGQKRGQFSPEACRAHVMSHLTWDAHKQQALKHFEQYGYRL
ncbi:MAG: glycosyltransferase family 4 protein [Saccharospirillum sp.]